MENDIYYLLCLLYMRILLLKVLFMIYIMVFNNEENVVANVIYSINSYFTPR